MVHAGCCCLPHRPPGVSPGTCRPVNPAQLCPVSTYSTQAALPGLGAELALFIAHAWEPAWASEDTLDAMGTCWLLPLLCVHRCRFTKFHSNDGTISHPEPCLQAFSHWTWHYWAQAAHPEEAVVVDLQGIKKGTHEFLLTDPAIHTCNSRRLVGLLAVSFTHHPYRQVAA